ncbi:MULTISPECIES: YciC family protein [Nostocales]|uniref:Glycerophosphoryl diester phosphodiesterase membrane domain-containing protein n=3 Tax=Nostocales TaxID=1161 RepID=A0A0C1QVY5_9CYAN|nr:YciC family protein [Tolypothrix bouteillei]KAF3884458.1 hypothetical protein DA73_0400002470 [Tolypothrix bouteillei VB521301]
MKKLKEAIAIFSDNIILFSLIILTIRFPANILSEIVVHNLTPKDEYAKLIAEFRVSSFFSAIFDPIYVGALISSLWEIKQGRSCNYFEAMSAGIKNWGQIFTIRLISGFFQTLGFFAFVIPGIVLAVRYSLTDCIVVIEGYSNSSSILKRSAYLTKGKKWQIVVGTSLIVLLMLTYSFIVGIFSAFIENTVTTIIFSCILDIILAMVPILLFLFYWQARQVE